MRETPLSTLHYLLDGSGGIIIVYQHKEKLYEKRENLRHSTKYAKITKLITPREKFVEIREINASLWRHTNKHN
jgi:hypothetical protein